MSTDKLTCKQVARILSDGLDAQMPPAERTRLRLHMVVCEACRNVEQQFDLLRRLMRKAGPAERDDIPDDER
ncbi:MAG: zf-HC2 domain-containing protein [Aquincola sp.]|nr:zf-HC2 domain-containing protein [Aquincola sp.]MDH4289323.1 zf-HC2 domain-containing protein [Aquincola sp.]MDH5331509.1 zf-HC2 domain-containing protein [Aquincola sp.]